MSINTSYQILGTSNDYLNIGKDNRIIEGVRLMADTLLERRLPPPYCILQNEAVSLTLTAQRGTIRALTNANRSMTSVIGSSLDE